MTLPGFGSAISSAEFSAGPMPCVSPDGKIPAESGPALARVSPSRPLANAKEPQTSATYGPSGSISSVSAALSESLASRLQARLGMDGSMEYRQTWKRKVTPAGRLYWAHTASARRTSGNDCGGWPTPQAHDVSGRSEGQKAKHGTKHGCSCLVQTARMAGWNTPRATDGSNGGPNQAGGALPADAARAGWATPAAREPGGTVERFLERKREANAKGSSMGVSVTALSMQAQLTPGAMPSGSSAPTAKRGALNPALSRWLMGYPDEWDCCGAMAMRLCLSVRRSS